MGNLKCLGASLFRDGLTAERSAVRIVTIGGYGFTEKSFIEALKEAKVDTFVDIRQRRGMRGPKYAFLNSQKLQKILALENIRYLYDRDLAPTSAVRAAQKSSDQINGVAKQDRDHLSTDFVNRYNSEVLGAYDAEHLLKSLATSKTVAFFCVEGPPAACHRLLAANYLLSVLDSKENVEHLRP
ncbi:DUF488 domain-containing protein [Sphingomonas pseudosanguinis]|uniref:DUF488 domain-containing protein n=1 Tax=Sphingomonas pseudosanguinis TaxID=413712 RepID=A0A7W6AEH5_9SPHN|nr:DUF488 domain-containing protein [Sphingomonas pseudosanguinis]MBB3879131.1 hypothetical protein [Sphingomonas pseudosanguinis]MBN3537153.1 DUF488 domain-containing protein [Sphingomonas pseudosanguinis]